LAIVLIEQDREYQTDLNEQSKRFATCEGKLLAAGDLTSLHQILLYLLPSPSRITLKTILIVSMIHPYFDCATTTTWLAFTNHMVN
jgi:hypothetical protein